MDFITELDEAIKSGLQGFKFYLQRQMELQADFLEYFFCTSNAAQVTVLTYLIGSYVERAEADDIKNNELKTMMEYVLALAGNKNTGNPLHLAVKQGKLQLACYLLDLQLTNRSHCLFDIEQRDEEGRTLLALVLNTQHPPLLEALLKKKPNLYVPTNVSNARIPFQPIHQAVVLNYAAGIRLLAQHGAQFDNPCGLGHDTPVLLAAHLCKIDALEALLEQPLERLVVTAERSVQIKGQISKQNAIERLCEHFNEGKNKSEALRGVAMLLCRGAEPPRTEAMRQLLTDNRSSLLKAIDAYLALDDNAHLVDAFVNRCHLTESALHNIVYARHSWGNAIRHLFGKPSDSAFIIENLIVRKYSTNSQDAPASIPKALADNISLETDPSKLYALFVKRYSDAYNNQLITNSWSKMRWMIAEGECDWAKVQRYVATNPLSRSAIVYNEMFNPLPKIHDEIQDIPELSSIINTPSY